MRRSSGSLRIREAWRPKFDTWQLGFIEANVLIIFEVVGQDMAVFDLRDQALDIDTMIRGATRIQEIDGGGQEVTGAEDIALLEMIACCREFHEAVEKFGALPRFEGDELFEIVMAFQIFAAVEELDPSL
jgi:hypothetical protein